MTAARLRFHALQSSAFWALMGDVLPMFAAMVVAPALLRTLGAERMGVLSLIWVFVGYLSFLDLGLGRAVTVAVAAVPSGLSPERAELKVTGSALFALLFLGSISALVLAGVLHVFTIPFHLSSPALEEEVRTATNWILPSLPLLLVTSALRGHFEGKGAFRNLNMVRIPAGVMLIVGPFLTAQWTPDLSWAAISILLVRLFQMLALLKLLAHQQRLSVSESLKKMYFLSGWQQLKTLLSFGGWMTLSSVLGPVILYADRFVIGLMVGASIVSLYTIPFDVVSRFPVLIASACSVLLPELVRASHFSKNEQDHGSEWRDILNHAHWLAGGLVSTCAVTGWFVLPDFIAWWMGAAFAADAARLAQVLLIAFAINALTQIPYLALLANRQTRIIATIHLLEIVPYLVCLWWAVSTLGLWGAALASVGRGLVDFVLMTLACRYGVQSPKTKETM
ncbi:oligosaccharide flippase family protein [Rhodoferax sp.]|uniref:oligosaccharide flippase family protein n=1 Tax=Rhodoferax sp. TaxID=50421 RepID=UPI0025E4570A|nr:oligosaccharide flippase family protein [Rhodoferax sp.]